MALVALFLFNAALSFALSLLLATLLGPVAFGGYAIGLSAAMVLNVALFDWLRLSVARFYGERARIGMPSIRGTLGRAYAGMALVLVVATAVGVALGPAAGLGPTTGSGPATVFGPAAGFGGALIAATGLLALATGACEYHLILARARFLERLYMAVGGTRALLTALLAAAGALLSRDPAAALLGGAVGALLPALWARGRLADPAPEGRAFDPAWLKTFAAYGLPLVAASALYQSLPLLNRSLLAAREGLAEAGYFGLPSELVSRLFQNLGAALDLVLFQLVVRAEERQGRVAAERQALRNAGNVAAIVIPTAAGLLVVWPGFEAVFVPESFRGRVAGPIRWLVPALAIFAVAQYALTAPFQLRRRTRPVIAAAGLAVVVDLAVALAWPGRLGPTEVAAAQCAGTATGLAALLVLSVRAGARLPWRDVGGAALASAIMAGIVASLGHLPLGPAAVLPLQVASGAVAYGALAIWLDLAGLRGFVIRTARRIVVRRERRRRSLADS